MYQKDVHYNTDLEKAILGICLLEADAFGRLYGLLTKQHFYQDAHQQVFEEMAEMYSLNIPVDLLTVADRLIRVKQQFVLAKSNTAFFLTALTNQVTGSAHLEYWCYLLQTMWMEREIIQLTNSGIDGYEGDTRQKLFQLQERMMQLSQKEHEDDFKDMSQLMVELYQHQDEMRKNKGMGITTGIDTLDRSNGGYQPGQLVLIGARPSVGKSALAGQMAHAMAKSGLTVAFITLEMNNNEIAARLAAIDTQTDFNILYRGLNIDERQAERLHTKIANETAMLPLYVSDKTAVDITAIRAKVHKLTNQIKRQQAKAKQPVTGIGAIFIDYLQLIEGSNNKNRNREQEVSAISRGLKLIAKEMSLPVIAMAQLSRAVTQRKGSSRFPELSDFRESGSLEQDADVVIFLHKDFLIGVEFDENGQSTENQAHAVVRKWRNENANFIIPLDWHGKQMRFTERGDSFAATTSDEIEEDMF